MKRLKRLFGTCSKRRQSRLILRGRTQYVLLSQILCTSRSILWQKGKSHGKRCAYFHFVTVRVCFIVLEQYVDMLKTKEAEEKEARMNRNRPAIRNMLKGNPNVFHYTSFETADQLFAQHPIWQQGRIEAERRQLFREYIGDLQQREQVCLSLPGWNASCNKFRPVFVKCEAGIWRKWSGYSKCMK
jgi:hypothetical protein